ncbi:MAG: phosphoribosyl-ATP diphosphatase [Ostreibacterium sp.]
MEKITNDIFLQLEAVIARRMAQSPDNSYVATLNHKGLDTILKKIGEEATEVVIAAKNDEQQTNKSAIIYESCDLIFHLMVLLGNKGIQLSDIQVELERRFGVSGITEKATRTD